MRRSCEFYTELVAEIFTKAGLRPARARQQANLFVTTEAKGVLSHGLALVNKYTEQFLKGTINTEPQIRIERKTPAVAAIDGDGGLGVTVAEAGIGLAMEMSETFGIASVSMTNLQHYSHGFASLQNEDDQNCDDQCIDDRGLDKDKAQHHGRTDAAGRLRLPGHTLGALADGDGHAERTGGRNKADDDCGGNRLRTGRVTGRGGSGRFFGWLRSVGRTCGHGQHRTDEHHGKQQRYDSFRRNFHDKLPPIFKRFGVSVCAAL